MSVKAIPVSMGVSARIWSMGSVAPAPQVSMELCQSGALPLISTWEKMKAAYFFCITLQILYLGTIFPLGFFLPDTTRMCCECI